MTAQPVFSSFLSRLVSAQPWLASLALVASLLAVPGTAGAVDVYGTRFFDETWTAANNPYVLVGDVTFGNQATLTIEEGVEIQFEDTDLLGAGEDPNAVELIILGEIQALGTPTNPIVMSDASPGGAVDARRIFEVEHRIALAAQLDPLQ